MRYDILFIASALLFSSSALAEPSARTRYLLKCSGCHLPDGSGEISGGIPNFVGSVGVFADLPEGRAYLMHVPGVIGSSMDDKGISDVMNYIMETFAGTSLSSDYRSFSPREVSELRKKNIGNLVEYRRKVAALLNKRGVTLPPYPWP
ncbi:c-type cytochrome [Gluconacetobacter tumulicola]|uniref:Cytochrome c domain-containing protein n=1 Tax=Gluconacetobacter tumulicola TaxID=1017177 RepID=A0A7W4JAL5_9PROT|nr:hypothetical protein [Gluconacetobacter tumulicola]MBB2177730.1 hypothetical protein [Gluconacetobacter tumulicola]